MFLPIRDGIRVALQTLEMLDTSMENRDGYLEHFEYHLRARIVSKIKEVGSPKSKEVVDEGIQTLPQPSTSSPDARKRPREPTASPEGPKSKKPKEKRPKASNKKKE